MLVCQQVLFFIKMRNLRKKYLSLTVLTLHSAILGLSIRHVRSKTVPMFLPSTAVICTELLKFSICLGLIYKDEHTNFKNIITKHILCLNTIKVNSISKKTNFIPFLQICVPSCLFVIQNNLLYVSASHLDAATYQITYQLKILSTALFSTLILKRRLSFKQWLSVILLFLGVVFVQTETLNFKENRIIGCISALIASALSGLAGVLLEKMYKESEISIWVRNLQLSFFSLPLAFFLKNDTSNFFYGYDYFVIFVIIIQAIGGLLVAIVIKDAGSILKNFATALGIILICLLAIYLFNFELTLQFIIGVILVIVSIFLYSF